MSQILEQLLPLIGLLVVAAIILGVLKVMSARKKSGGFGFPYQAIPHLGSNNVDALDIGIREFCPVDGDWRPLDTLLDQAFASTSPESHYDAIFNLFERFPEDDGSGVFWTALHGMEACGNYEKKLLLCFRRTPNLMTRTMLRRICNSGQKDIEGFPIDRLFDVQK